MTTRAAVLDSDPVEHFCDGCHREFRPPRRRTSLGLGGRLTVLRMALGAGLRRRQGLRSAYRSIASRRLAGANEEAFAAFVGKFRLCHECRGFVCLKCWDGKRQICRSCVRSDREVGSASRHLPQPPHLAASAVAPAVAPAVASALMPADYPADRARAGRRLPPPIRALGAPFRPGRLRTAASVLLMTAALLLGAAEIGYLVAASAR